MGDEDADMDNQMCTLMRRAAELQHHVEAAAACGASQALARATAPSQDGVPAKILPNGPEATTDAAAVSPVTGNSNLNTDEEADLNNQMYALMRRADELQQQVDAAAACGTSQALARATAPPQDGVPAKILPNGPEATADVVAVSPVAGNSNLNMDEDADMDK